ncbi:unnamed protein product, partial [Ixodes pacificus]
DGARCRTPWRRPRPAHAHWARLPWQRLGLLGRASSEPELARSASWPIVARAPGLRGPNLRRSSASSVDAVRGVRWSAAATANGGSVAAPSSRPWQRYDAEDDAVPGRRTTRARTTLPCRRRRGRRGGGGALRPPRSPRVCRWRPDGGPSGP